MRPRRARRPRRRIVVAGSPSPPVVRRRWQLGLLGQRGLLAAHVAGRFVGPHPEIDGLAQQAIARPLGEPDLHYELGLHPVGPLGRFERVGKRARARRVPVQPRGHAVEFLLVESRADAPGPAELAALVVADEQRAEVVATVPRIGPSADDELLLFEELELAPRRAALAAVIHGVAVLDDEAFPAFLARPGQQRTAVVGGDFAQAHSALLGARRLDAGLERQAPFGQRPAAQVVGAVAKQVEHHERRRLLPRRAFDVGGGGQVNAALDVLEAQRRRRPVGRDDLSIEQDRRLEPARDLQQDPGDLRKLRRLVVAVARVERHPRVPPRLDVGQCPQPVVLGLVDQPPLNDGRRGHRRQHRPHGRRLLMPEGHGGDCTYWAIGPLGHWVIGSLNH